MIAVIQYDAGNTGSVLHAIRHLGYSAILTNDPDTLREADRVIFPGVGHAEKAMNKLVQKGLDRVIPQLTNPFLGICLGMQLLGKHSEEGDVPTLHILPFITRAFQVELPVPHMGWNQVKAEQSQMGIGHFYFVHSYYVPIGPWTQWVSEYPHSFSAGIAHQNFFGVQFHPEKSGTAGLQLLQNFLSSCKLFPPSIS